MSQHKGHYPPGECSCGRTGITQFCCTFANYNDGSTDEPTCDECCPNDHRRRFDSDRYYLPAADVGGDW